MTNSPAHVSRYRRPLHPPFTYFPIAAYVLAAGFDVISVIGGSGHAWASELWHAGTFVLIAGLALCPMTMLSGLADLIRFEERQPAAVDHGGRGAAHRTADPAADGAGALAGRNSAREQRY